MMNNIPEITNRYEGQVSGNGGKAK